MGAGIFLSSVWAQQQAPIVVRIVETPRDPTGIANVLIGALGLTGALALMAVVLGLAMGGLVFLVRSRH